MKIYLIYPRKLKIQPHLVELFSISDKHHATPIISGFNATIILSNLFTIIEMLQKYLRIKIFIYKK